MRGEFEFLFILDFKKMSILEYKLLIMNYWKTIFTFLIENAYD